MIDARTRTVERGPMCRWPRLCAESLPSQASASRRFVPSYSWEGVQPCGLCEVGHQGLMQDEEDGVVYARHRYLQSVMGRWMQRDPAQYVNGPNLYLFVKSNPIYYVDPTGTDAQGTDWDIASQEYGAPRHQPASHEGLPPPPKCAYTGQS